MKVQDLYFAFKLCSGGGVYLHFLISLHRQSQQFINHGWSKLQHGIYIYIYMPGNLFYLSEKLMYDSII